MLEIIRKCETIVFELDYKRGKTQKLNGKK
jgi:hypothetical protein